MSYKHVDIRVSAPCRSVASLHIPSGICSAGLDALSRFSRSHKEQYRRVVHSMSLLRGLCFRVSVTVRILRNLPGRV
jgi:hypothetical protein